MAAPTLSAATITQESGKFSWTDVNFDHGVSIKELLNSNGASVCSFDATTKKITMNGSTSGTFGAFYEIEITVPFHFSGLKGNIVVNKETTSGSGPDNYYYPTDLTTWNQSYTDIFVNDNYGGMITGSEHQIIANSAGFSSGTTLNGGAQNNTTFTQTYTETTGMKPTNIIRIRMYQDHARHWSIAASDFNIQALPDVSFPIVQMAFSAAIANNTNVNADDFSLKIHGESTPIGKVLIDSGNVLLLPGIDKRSPLVTNSPIVDASIVSDKIQLTFNNNLADSDFVKSDFVVTDGSVNFFLSSVYQSSNKLILIAGGGHTFSTLTNVRIVYTRHATASRHIKYVDNTPVESFDVLLDNTLSAANRNKAIEVTYTKHGTANRNIADASSNAVATFTQNNDNTSAPTLSSMTIGDEGHRMGGWRKLDYTGGVKITELANVAGGSVCKFNETTNTISMNGSTSGTFGAFYQIDITVPYKITGLRGQLLVQSDNSAGNALADDYHYPEDLTTWVQSYHEINLNSNYGSWLVGTDKQIIARVGGTNGSGVLNSPSKGNGNGSMPLKRPVLLKYVQTTSMTSTNVVRIQVYQDHARHWTIKELQLEVLPDPSLKLVELNFSDTVFFGSNVKPDIFSVKRGNESVKVVDVKSVGSKILLLTGGEFTHADQANVEYYNDKFSSVAANGNNLDITFSNDVFLTDDIANDIILKTSDGIPINVDASISSGKLSLTKKGNTDLSSQNSPLKSNFAYSHAEGTENASYPISNSFTVSNGIYVGVGYLYNSTTGAYTGSQTTSSYSGHWIQIDLGVSTIVKRIDIFFSTTRAQYPKDFRIFGSTDNSTFTQILDVTNRPFTADVKDFTYYISGASAARYYRLAANKVYNANRMDGPGYIKFTGIPDSSASFSNTNYTIEYNQSAINKLVKSNDINIAIPSFKIVNGVDNTILMKNLSGNTISTFTKNNGDSSTPLCTSLSVASENSRMGGWRKLDYTGGVTIKELANIVGSSVCTFNETTNEISMNGSSSGTFGAFYQIDITVPYKITGLRGQLLVQSDVSGSLVDDYYYPETLTTWVQSYHEININSDYGSWLVGTDKQIIARVGGTNGSGVLSSPSKGNGNGTIPLNNPILLKYVQTTNMASTNVVRIQVYQDHARHWTLKELQLEVLPDTNLKLVELNFSSNMALNSSLKKDIINLKRGGEKINIIDIKESSSKALLLTDGEFQHADEIDVKYYQEQVSNVTVDNGNLQITFNNNITSIRPPDYRDFTVTTLNGIAIPFTPTISNGKLIISKTESDSSQLMDLSSPDSIFKDDFLYSSSTSKDGVNNTNNGVQNAFKLTNDGFMGARESSYSGTDNAYVGSTYTTNGYGGQWFQIDIGRQVTVRLIKYKFIAKGGTRRPMEVKVFGSNNNSSWTDIVTLEYGGANNAEEEKSTPTAGNYRYYRFVSGKHTGLSSNSHFPFQDYVQLLGFPEESTFTNTKYKIEYNKSSSTKTNLVRASDSSIHINSFKIIDGTEYTTTISNYRGTSVSSFSQNSGDSSAPSFHSAAIVNENSKFGWQSVTLETPTITMVAQTTYGETMVWDNTDKTATMSGSTYSSPWVNSVIQLDFKAPCYFVGLRGQFKIESLTSEEADDYHYPETLSTWNQSLTDIIKNSNYGANLLGSDKQIIGRVGGTNGSGVLNTTSKGNGVGQIPVNNPVFLKYVQTTGMTESNIIRIRIYQESRQQYKLSDFHFEVIPATTYKIVELTLSENAIHKENFDTTDFDIKGLGEVGQISKMKAESGKLYLLPSMRVPVLTSLNLRYRANTFSSIAVVSGNLDITFSNDVTVSGSLNSNNIVVKDSQQFTIPVIPTIYDNKLRLTKDTNVKFSHDKSLISAYSASSSYSTYVPSELFDGNNTGSSWLSTASNYSTGSYSGSASTAGYAGDWVQIETGTTVTLDNLKIWATSTSRSPKDMRFFSSTDGTTWTQVADWTNLTMADNWKPGGNYAPVVKTGLSSTGRYFRLAINKNLGTSYTDVKEIELFGSIGTTSFTTTDGTVIYTKSGIASENIVSASDSSQAIGSFTIFNGSEDLTGHLTDLAGNTLPAFNVLSADSTAPTVSSSSLSGANLTLVFSEDIYDKDTYNTADFDVQLSGDSMTINSLSISSGNIVLTLGTTPSSINALRVVYTKHATTSRNIVDNAGNPVASFTHIPSNDSTPPTFAGMSVGGVHTGTGLIESVIAKAETDYGPSYSSIALASGKIEVTFTSNVATVGDTSNYTIKQGGTTLPGASPSISNGKLVIDPGYILDVSAYDIASSSSSLSGQAYTSSTQLSNTYPPSKAFDNASGYWITHNMYSGTSYNGTESTEGYAGEWVQVDIGQTVLLTSYEIVPGNRPTDDAHPMDMRFFYSSNGTNWTQLRDWTGLTKSDDWYPNSTWTSQGPYATQTIGRYFRLAINKKGPHGGWVTVGEIKLKGVRHTSETSQGTFSTLGNVEVDYIKGTGNNNLRDSNGFDVPSFEITNGTNTTEVVPAYASIATANNNIEITFNQTLVDPGSLSKDDFHVTYNGSVTGGIPSISGGKLIINSGYIYNNSISPYDLTSTSSSLYGTRGNITFSSEYNHNSHRWPLAFDNSTNGPAVTAAGSYSSNVPASTTNTVVSGTTYNGHWVQIDIGQEVLVKTFEYTPRTNHKNHSWDTLLLAGSKNGTTWDLLWRETGRSQDGSTTETYSVDATDVYSQFRWICEKNHGGSYAWNAMEMRLKGQKKSEANTTGNFTSTSNLVVDYMRHPSDTNRRLKNADGDEVASFEITNGSLTNDQTKPTFSSVAASSGKLELTFSENVAVTGTLDATDFSVIDSGATITLKSITVSNGKVLIEPKAYRTGSTAAYDIASNTSTLSGSRTYTSSSDYSGTYAKEKAFNNDNTSIYSWISANNTYSGGSYSGSESTDGYDGEWIQVDVGTNVILTSYEIYPRGNADWAHAKKMRFFSSTDGTNWTQVRDWTGLTTAHDWKVGGSYTSVGPYTTLTEGRYFRLVVNELLGSSGVYAQIGEIKLLGVAFSQATAQSFTDTDVTIKYIKNSDSSKQLIRVNDPSDAVNSFTVTNGTDTTPEVTTPKDGILIDFDENIASSSGYAAGNFTVTEGSTSKSVRAVKITSDNKVFLSMLTDINSISDTNITYAPSSTASENLETTEGAKTLGFTITNGSDATTRIDDRLVMNFSESIVSKKTYSPDDFLILENVTKTSTTTFTSAAVASGKLELSFNNNVAVTGALNIDDFTIKDTSGNDVFIKTPTISNGKLIIENNSYNSTGTSVDLSSTSSNFTRTYTHSTIWGGFNTNMAFDNDSSTYWQSGVLTNGSSSTDGYGKDWVQVDVGQTVIVTSYEIENRGCKDMRFYYSTDGSNWTQVREWTDLNTHTTLGPYSTSTVYGRYFRLAVNTSHGSTATIKEFKLLGYAQESEPSKVAFTSTDYLITYTKHATASRNIVKAGATTDAIDTFRILNGSETGVVKNVAQVAVVGGDVQLKTPIILSDNPASIDIASSTSTLTGTRTYTHSSQYSSVYPASEAFDNNNTGSSDSWISKNGTYSSGVHNGSGSTEGYAGEWFQVDVGTNVILTSYEIYTRGTTDNNHAEKMRLFSSTDGTSWAQVRDWTGLTLTNDWKVGGSYTSVGPYTTKTYGRFFRLAVNKLIGNGGSAQIGELKLLGYAVTFDSFGSDIGNFEIQYTNPGINGRNLVDLAGNVVETFTGRSRPSYKSGTLTTTRRIEVTFTVNLKDMTPLKSDFDVKLNGTSTSIESVSISGGKLILILSKTMTPHSDSDPQVLTLNYNKNSSATYNIRDAGDSAVESLTGKSITNPTSDTEPPIFVGAEIFDDEPKKIILNFDFAVAITSANVSTFSVKVNGSAVTVSSVAVSGGDVVLTLENAVSHTDTITVSYTKDDSDADKNIKDTSNNVLETPLRSEHGTIKVTVVNEGSGNKYALGGVTTKNINLVKGITYEFDTSDTSVSGHPFKLSTTKNGTHASGSEYTSGVTHSGTPGSSGAKTTFVVPNGAPATLYYYCGNHSGMGGDATITILTDSFAPVVNSVVATAVKSFKNDIQSGGIRDGITAKRWSRFRADKSVLTKSQRKYYGKDYFRTNPSAKIFKIIDEYNGQSIAFLKPSKSGDPGTAQAIDLDSDEAEIAFDNTSAEQSSLVSFTFDPLRNDNTTNTVTVKFLFVKRITGTTAKFTYTLDGYSGAGDYANKVVLTPAFSGGGTTGLITVTNMDSDTEQTLTCDVTIEYSPSVGSTLEYTKSFTFFGRNPAGGFSNDNSSTAGDPYIKTIRGVFYKLRDIPHKSVILYDNSNSDRRIQVHGYLEPNVNYKKQVEEFDDSLVSQLGERPINPSFFSKLWIRNKNQEYLIDLETWTELKTGKNIIDLFKVDFAIETCKFNVYLSEKCVTVKLPIDGNFYIIIKRFMNPEIRTGVELSIPTWQSSPLAFGALIYPGETHDIFIDKLDDKTLKRKARKLENMTTVQENFANPETGIVKVVDWKY